MIKITIFNCPGIHKLKKIPLTWDAADDYYRTVNSDLIMKLRGQVDYSIEIAYLPVKNWNSFRAGGIEVVGEITREVKKIIIQSDKLGRIAAGLGK